ncbi:MAG TPA: helicase-associated domain-containing protein [Planctomycetota bacterium]|nr:helicase-associated domain-containing protein [Planctomycetota bacterium]HRR81759.1 helicase-associated domain-containing protein [Planctomycetota bacterium]HRT94194.1 helicase-associated domain-containing protein [Planctomycetota bacterium]
MQLDEFLNARSIANLQILQWIWAPATRRSASKHELLRTLRQQMLSPERAREGFLNLDEAQQEFLRGLLRLDGYEGEARVLLRRLSTPPATAQAERELAEDLDRRGFLACSMRKVWGQAETLFVTMPAELGDVLAEVLNLDLRDPALMLSLRAYLARRPPDVRRRLAGAPGAPETLLADLVRPEAVEARIAALPSDALRRAVRLALDDHAGILPLERFPSLGLDMEAVDASAWRSALEAGLLGTFGHLSLLEHGLGDDHDCLALYQEIVEAHAAARAVAKPDLDHTYACGVDFLTDLMAAVDFLRANPSKLTAAGRFFKGARNQLLPQAALRTGFFMDEDSLLAFKLAAARELGLLETRDDGRVSAAPGAAAWQSGPLVEQARALLDALLRLAEGACPPVHFRALARLARDVLLAARPGVWMPTNAFLARLVSRYLLELLQREAPQAQEPAAADEALWRYPRALRTVAAVLADAREPLLQALNYAGVMDIGRCGGQSFVAASPLAPILLGSAPLPAPRGPLLLVNPDAEVILFPEEGHLELLHRLCAFCERGKNEVTLHLRITQESVQKAVLRGLTPDAILATLARNNRAPLPQNIEYSVRNWAAGVHPAKVCTLHVLEVHSAEALDAALRLPEVAPLVVRRLSPTAAVLCAPQLGPEAEAALKQLGIHLM